MSKTLRPWWIAIALLATLLPACGGDDGPDCDEGWRLVDGTCVPPEDDGGPTDSGSTDAAEDSSEPPADSGPTDAGSDATTPPQDAGGDAAPTDGGGDAGSGLAGLGETCSAPGDCESHHCVDDVCCESACGGDCATCNSEGTCVPDDTACASCATCTETGSGFSCDETDCGCSTADAPNATGTCGEAPEETVTSGCTLTHTHWEQTSSAVSDDVTTYECVEGTWTNESTSGDGGGCSGCEPARGDQWTASCLTDWNPTVECCPTTTLDDYTGACGTAPDAWIADGCRYRYTHVTTTSSSVSDSSTPYDCEGGSWTAGTTSSDGGSCPDCTPGQEDHWDNQCGDTGDRDLTCAT